MIPFGDIVIQHFIKKNAKEKIANKFGDDVIEFNKKDKKLTEKEKDSLNEIKDKSNDNKSDILKSLARGFTLGFNVFAKTIFLPIAFVGCGIGIIVGGVVMDYDIKAYLEFYGKRFMYRCLVNLSFDLIEKYLKENFENEENI